MDAALRLHRGSCHCGAVTFEVTAPAVVEATECNCSICRKSAYLHLIVPASRFRLLSGEDNITVYRFNTGVARHMFCSTCGIKPFYVPRSHPDGYSVNVHCIDGDSIERVEVTAFDGRHWEDNVDRLKPLAEAPPGSD